MALQGRSEHGAIIGKASQGGSSGGSAAALAAGLSRLSIGSAMRKSCSHVDLRCGMLRDPTISGAAIQAPAILRCA